MSTLGLIPHGAYVAPDYAPRPGSTEGLAGRSTDEERQPGIETIKQRFRRDEYMGRDPQAMGCIKAIYEDAIEYRTQTSEKMGGLFCWGVLLFLMGAFMYVFAQVIYNEPKNRDLAILSAVTLLPFVGIGIYMLAKGIRAVYRPPSDLPVIFDRKHRKVYRLLQEIPPGILGMFKPWPIRAVSYDWDLIDAEHHTQLHVHTAGSHRNDFLIFIVRKSADDPTIIDSFNLGNPSLFSDVMAANMYEHVRRFMEEHGPHLPRRDEPLAQYREEQISWWQTQDALGPFGPQYRKWWRDVPLTTVLAHLCIFVSLPMGLLFGTGNWLGHKTARLVRWPQEVLDAIGPALRTGGGYRRVADEQRLC